MYALPIPFWPVVSVGPSAGSHRHICSGWFYSAYLKKDKRWTDNWVKMGILLRNPQYTPNIPRIYLERWTGKKRMKSRYLLTPEDKSTTASKLINKSEWVHHDLLGFTENSLFILEIHWSKFFDRSIRMKTKKGR